MPHVSRTTVIAALCAAAALTIIPASPASAGAGAPPPPGNLTANPSFETGTSGWSGWNASLSRVSLGSSAPDGSWVAQVTQTQGNYYTIDDWPETVSSTSKGEVYTASAWVAGSAATVGKPIELVVRESNQSGTVIGQRSVSSTLGNGFQQLTVTYPERADGDVVDLYVEQQNAAAGDSFQVDDITLTRTPVFGVHSHAFWFSDTTDQQNQEIDAVAASGAGWIRFDVGWDNLETARGVYDSANVARLDAIVNRADADGLKVLMVLYETPGWANGDQAPAVPPTDPNDYADYAAWAAGYFKGRVQAYEFWNEPDPNQSFFQGTVAQYVGLVKAAYPALKQADPSATAVTGGASSVNADWIQACYDAGWRGYFDALAIHPYPSPSNMAPETPVDPNYAQYYLTNTPAVRQIMVNEGDGAKPIWYTEFGWSSHDNTSTTPNWDLGVSESTQADYLLRALKYVGANYPYVTTAIWYNARNRTDGDPTTAAGLQIDNFGLLNSDFSAKPAYTSAQNYLLNGVG